jgi:uncharacterized protein YjbJ (UPF0337 family)
LIEVAVLFGEPFRFWRIIRVAGRHPPPARGWPQYEAQSAFQSVAPHRLSILARPSSASYEAAAPGTSPALPAFSLHLIFIKGENAMNWDRVEGNWKEIKGKVHQQWGKLTNDDLEVIHGKRIELTGRLQQRYGIAKDEAERQIDDWLKTTH